MRISRFLAVTLLTGASCLAAATTALAPSHEDKVISVGKDSITIQTHGKAGLKFTDIDNNGRRTTEKPSNVATYHITTLTEITVDGIPGKLIDLRPGMEISVTADMNPTDAASIDAHTLIPEEKPAKKDAKKKAPATGNRAGVTFKSAFHKITGETIIAVTPNRITVGQGGAKTATAYLITPLTTVTINGKPGTVAALEKGMAVSVSAGSENTAASIDASDVGE